jgi:hypothetical protein
MDDGKQTAEDGRTDGEYGRAITRKRFYSKDTNE